MSKKNVPMLRFEGFSDDWEQRKVFELGEIITGNTPSTGNKDYYKGQYLFVSPADIQDNRYVSKTNTTLTELGFKTGRFIRKGSTLFVSIGSTIGKVGQADRDLITNQQINSIIPSNDYDDNFVYSILLGKSAKIKQLAATQAVPIINKTEFGKTIINVPSFEEQIKIGTFFKQLDDTIALHQRKLGQLKRLKQGFLQGLFANDTNVPKLRFAGFTEKWEQRKFNNCFNFPVSTNSLSRAMLNYDNGEIKNIHYGDILIKYSTILNVKEDEIPYITGGELEKYKSNLLENQDLIFADAAEDESVGKAVEVSGITNENLVSGLHTIVARVKGEKAPFFWGYYINSDIYHRQLLRLMQGSKVSAISKGNLQKTNVSFPNRMKEQQKIGTFFKQLDDTITLHQNKLSQLKKLKKALLQSMFI